MPCRDPGCVSRGRVQTGAATGQDLPDLPVTHIGQPVRVFLAPFQSSLVAVDAKAGKIILVEKIYPEADGTPGIYEMPLPTTLTGPKQTLVAKRVGEIKTKNLTGMDISDDGRRLVLRNYPHGWVYEKGPDQSWAEVLGGEPPATITLPLQPQGEGVCFSADGKSILLSSENVKQPIWRLPIP